MYTVTGFFHTGFNAVNVPASPAVLYSSGATKDFPAVDLLQDDGLSYVDLRTSWEDIEEVDYIKVGSIYYCVDGSPVMTSPDVARVPLLADYLLTAGGAGSLTYTDGLTERFSVDSSSDSWGSYPEHDPYMAPFTPPVLDIGSYVCDDAGGATYKLCESTIDLVKLGGQFVGGQFIGKGITFKDDISGEKVTIPYTPGDPGQTELIFGSYGFILPGAKLYDATNPVVKNGMDACRCIGAESAITAQVAIPKALISSISITEKGEVSSIKGKSGSAETGLSMDFLSGVPKKILYSDYNKYGMISSSGSKMECSPLQASPDGASPSVSYVVDPNPTDGKPYFKFSGLPGQTYHSFFLNCIDGAPWASVPLVYRTASGSYQSQVQFDLAAKKDEAENRYRGTLAGVATTSGIASTVASAAGNVFSGNFGAAAGSIVSGVAGIASTLYTENYRKQQYEMARNRELYDFGISQSIVVPQVQCPFNASLLRDYFGNGCFTYRLRYGNEDATRISNILRRFGYKATYKLTAAMFTPDSSTGFAYVRASGVAVAGNIPKRWKEGISTQLSVGVRVWSKHPTET